MNAADFVLQETSLKETSGFRKAIELFEAGLGLGEVFYTPEVWNDKGLGFWNLDRISLAHTKYLKLKVKKEKYIKDIESRQTPPEGAVDALTKAVTLEGLEEAFRPFKRKKKTRATLAREAGLLDFANLVQEKAQKGESFENGLESEAKKYIQPALGYITFETVLKGAQDILVEQGLENQGIRAELLADAFANAKIIIKAGDKLKDGGRYSNFVKAPVQTCNYYLNNKNYDKFPQIKKAWEDGFLKVTLDFDMSKQVALFDKAFVADGSGELADLLKAVSKKALEVHALPSVTTEIFDKFYLVSQSVYLSKLKSDYMSLLTTPAFGNKPVLGILEKENQKAAVVFISHKGEFVSSTTVDFAKDDVADNLKNLIEGITKNVELGCVALSLSDSVRKFEKLTVKVLADLGKTDDVQLVMAETRGLAQFINQPESKSGFEEKIDNASLSCFYMAKRVQNPLYEYGAHAPSTLLEVPNFMNKEEVDSELLKVLSYQVCSLGVTTSQVNLGLLKNLNWFKFEEERGLSDLCKKINAVEGLEKKDLESVFSSVDFERFSKYFKFEGALNILDSSRISQSDFSSIKDFLKGVDVSLLKGPVSELYKKVDESWIKLLGEDFSKYVSSELTTPFKETRKPYKVFSFSKSVESISDVKEDNLYWGVVTKFSTFGAFVNIGVGVEGLIHLSELSNEYLSDARKVLRLGQWVLIKAIKVDADARKLSFSKTKADESFKKKKPEVRGTKAQGERGGDRKRTDSRSNKRPDRKFDKNSKRPSNDRQQRKPKELFNNPFAALKGLK